MNLKTDKTMKKITKNVIKVAIFIVGGILFCKTYKKEKKRAEANYEKKEEEFSLAGIDIENEEGQNPLMGRDPFVYRMYQLLLRSSNWDLDDFDSSYNIYGPQGGSLEKIIEWECTGMNNTIHVLEDSDRNGKRMIHFYVQIPPFLGKTPLPSDYSNTLRELVMEFWKNSNIKNAQEPRVRYKGFYSYVSNEKMNYPDGSPANPEVFVEIPEDDYSKFAAPGKFDGLSRMISSFYENNHEKLDRVNCVSMNMYTTVSFPIDEELDEGIDMLQAISFLKGLIDTEIKPQKGARGMKQKLGPIIFHADGKLGVFYNQELEKEIMLIPDKD